MPEIEEVLVESLLKFLLGSRGVLWWGCCLALAAHQGFELGAEGVETVEAPGSVWEGQAGLT